MLTFWRLGRAMWRRGVLRSTVTRLSAISNHADFVHDVSTVHRCPRLWTPDGIVTNRDAVSFWVHGAYPVSRCPRGQGVRAVSSLLGFERSFLVRHGGPEIRRSKSPAIRHTTIRPRQG